MIVSLLVALVGLVLFVAGVGMSTYVIYWSYSLRWNGCLSVGILCGILSLSFPIITYCFLTELNERKGD